MSQENVDWARRAYRAFNRGDLAAAVEDFAPEFEWVATGVVPDLEGPYHGPEGYRRAIEFWWNEFDDPHIEVHELIEVGDQVVASLTIRGRGKRSGVETNWDVWHLWTLEDGKVTGHEVLASRAEALEAARLRE
jgi:ketosteroid isomerase-like protein